MQVSTLIQLLGGGQFSVLLALLKTGNEFYRASFISAALSGGVYENFTDGKAGFEQLCEKMAVSNREGLRAWLELGVSLGELKRTGDKYQIAGKISRALMNPANDAIKALLEEVVRYHYRYVLETPAMLRRHEWFPFDSTPGELIARSSRVNEPFIGEAVDAVVPAHGDFRLLEVGCGSGIYIQRACARNPSLRAVGLELQAEVADAARRNIQAWGLQDRAIIDHVDVREFSTEEKFDLVTLHQNVYYFPIAARQGLFVHLKGFLENGGKVLLTSVCQGGGPGTQGLNVQVSTTEGYSPLPDPDQLCQQLDAAGFVDVRARRLLPFESLWAFTAAKAL
jgi:SAM-dependent methyltransferase